MADAKASQEIARLAGVVVNNQNIIGVLQDFREKVQSGELTFEDGKGQLSQELSNADPILANKIRISRKKTDLFIIIDNQVSKLTEENEDIEKKLEELKKRAIEASKTRAAAAAEDVQFGGIAKRFKNALYSIITGVVRGLEVTGKIIHTVVEIVEFVFWSFLFWVIYLGHWPSWIIKIPWLGAKVAGFSGKEWVGKLIAELLNNVPSGWITFAGRTLGIRIDGYWINLGLTVILVSIVIKNFLDIFGFDIWKLLKNAVGKARATKEGETKSELGAGFFMFAWGFFRVFNIPPFSYHSNYTAYLNKYLGFRISWLNPLAWMCLIAGFMTLYEQAKNTGMFDKLGFVGTWIKKWQGKRQERAEDIEKSKQIYYSKLTPEIRAVLEQEYRPFLEAKGKWTESQRRQLEDDFKRLVKDILEGTGRINNLGIEGQDANQIIDDLFKRITVLMEKKKV